MASTKINFSFAILRDLPLPESGKRAYYYDTKIPGLELRVTSSGVKSFNVFRWHAHSNRPIRVNIGRFPDISIQDARKLASKVILEMTQGTNPNEQKRAIRQEMTLKELFNLCLETDYKLHNKTWKKYEAMYKLYLSHWDARQISSISREQVEALHSKVGTKHGKYAANRMLQLLRSMFNKAVTRGFKGMNPAQGIKLFKEESRARFLEADEVPGFFEALNTLTYEESGEPVSPDFKDFIWLCLLTGARQSNVLGMRWRDIHWEKAEWTIPMTKNGLSQRVPLVAQAVSILKARQEAASDFVFPAPGKVGHMHAPRKLWARLIEQAKLSDIRLHDLRRSLGSWQVATGANLSVVGKTLGHKSLKATQVYARLDLDPVRNAMKTATNALLEAGKLKEPPAVIPIELLRQKAK